MFIYFLHISPIKRGTYNLQQIQPLLAEIRKPINHYKSRTSPKEGYTTYKSDVQNPSNLTFANHHNRWPGQTAARQPRAPPVPHHLL